MACSRINTDEIEKISERLYSESYFRLLRLKNNPSEAASEFRDLIRQFDAHCSIQNVNKKCTEKLKSQLISEYSSLVDNQKHEGLLPVITNDVRKENEFHSLSKNKDNAQLKSRHYCVEFIERALNQYRNIDVGGNIKHNIVNPNNALNSNFSNRNTSHLCSDYSKVKQNDLLINRKTTSTSHNNMSLVSTNAKTSNDLTSISLKKSYTFNQKQFVQKYPENNLKRPASDSSSHYSKRNNCSTYKQNNNNETSSNKIRNSFIPAKSMYKNPLKTANTQEEKQLESIDTPESDLKNHPTLKNFDSKIVNIILSEIMDFSPDIKWTDIAGLEFVKSTVQEIVIWPLLRPDIFTGLRAPPRGILLFGPPGTGKTLIGKCIATESNSTFFCISASSLASKWVGESEQLVRALFAVAQLHQPAVIFIDEIDSLLSQRSDQEQDHTRKLKTEFLVQFDGAKTTQERRILVVGATNRPHELDEAARRRFVKRLYVPLPEDSARLQIIQKLLGTHQHNLSISDFNRVCEETKGYSGSDVAHLCKEAAMGPIRSIGPEQIKTVSLDQVRPIELIDFLDALKQVRASVAQEDLNYYLDWNKKFGSFAI